ncbi:unnamed protein product (macronuclear) [Paramecium tetraurelia]|uniref:Uncharacterized protein n=1 Tax=Paramecium tetraurelia TaxID=5888 RepID=A0EG27_PARTE|nr:uncharacterized protein GSPATT00026591001 [Paramecium tetraurelia]CAK94268.1 unnamed protein product [Paramecium tetraurelia]|eukprot:XP_001461641.1 hypothetical protein (macronuclear) [Paramecium tetraurelia strain d4-2]
MSSNIFTQCIFEQQICLRFIAYSIQFNIKILMTTQPILNMIYFSYRNAISSPFNQRLIYLKKMGCQINKPHAYFDGHLSQTLQRPQAKAEFIEVKVSDPGAPINSFLVECDDYLFDDHILSSFDQNRTKNDSSNFEDKRRTQSSNNFLIKPLKGILKTPTKPSRSSSRYFNEEAKFVKFQHNHDNLSQPKLKVVGKNRKTRQTRTATRI